MILKLFLFEVFETKCSSNLWKNIVCYVTNILIFNHVYLNGLIGSKYLFVVTLVRYLTDFSKCL